MRQPTIGDSLRISLRFLKATLARSTSKSNRLLTNRLIPGKYFPSASPQQLRRLQNLFRPRAHPIVFGKVQPTYCPRRIHQKLCRSRNVPAIGARSGVEQIVLTDCFSLRIREERKCVAGGFQHLAIDPGTVDADSNGTDSGFIKGRQLLFNAPQLGVTGWSPIPTVKNQQHTLRRLAVDRRSQQIS